MSLQRVQKRDNEKGREILKSLIDSFFSQAIKLRQPHEIIACYKKHESAWMYWAHKRNEGNKTKSFIMVDRFESSLMKAHIAIARSTQSTSTSLAMLRVLRHVQNKSRFRHFLIELPYWIKHVWETYKNFRKAKHHEMLNPSKQHLKVRQN